MKRALVSTMVLSCLALSTPLLAYAQEGSQVKAKIAGTVQARASKSQCTTNAPSGFACADDPSPGNLVTEWPAATPGDLYFVVLDGQPGPGVKGASFGIQYGANLFVGTATPCSDLEFPGNSWPASGGGNAFTYAACQDSVDATDPEGEVATVLGFMYVYAYGDELLQITQRTYIPTPDFKVADCSAAESNPPYPEHAGSVGFGATLGSSPCILEATTVEPSSWGAIKQSIGSSE